MALDKTIRTAIEDAVRDGDQSAQLSKKIIAWLEAVASGSEDIHDQEHAERRLEVLFDAVKVQGEEGE